MEPHTFIQYMYVCIVFDTNTSGLTRQLYHNTPYNREDKE
jgi:hypothetical protein